MKPFDFDRSVEVKSELHPPVEVRNDLGVEVKNDPNPQVRNDLGVKSTEEVRASLSPRLPKRPKEPSAATGERETTAAPHNDQTAPIVDAWQQARGGRRNPAAEKQIAATAAELLLAGWTIDDLTALAVDMAAKYPTGRDLTRHADHWQPPKTATPKPGPAAGLPTPCQTCEAAHPAARFNPRLRTTTNGEPCPNCHPDAAPLAA
jgi:hypothetical protein